MENCFTGENTMQKIRSKVDAREVAEQLIETNGYIVLRDEIDSGDVIEILENDEECKMIKFRRTDSVKGITSTGWMSRSLLPLIIWERRKFINQSGQLASILG